MIAGIDARGLIAIDAEARRIQMERCVRLVREHGLIATSDEVKQALDALAREMERPDV